MEALQLLVNIADEYARKWRFRYNIDKCYVINCGEASTDNSNIVLNKCIVKRKTTDKHLGLPLACNEAIESKEISKRVVKGKSICYGIKAIGSKSVPVSPKICSKLYWEVAMPKLSYGLEVCSINDDCSEIIESFHADVAKQFQGYPTHTSNIGALLTIGWKPAQCHIDFLRLLFLFQLLTLPMNCIYKCVAMNRFFQSCRSDKTRGPTATLVKTCKKYGLFDIMLRSVESGQYMQKCLWKCLVKQRLNLYYETVFNIRILMYKTLCNYDRCGKMSAWWIHVFYFPRLYRRCRTVMKIFLNTDMYKDRICNQCNNTILCTNYHLIFECSSAHNQRTRAWEGIVREAPVALLEELNSMSSREKMRFLANGFNVEYTKEWGELYSAVIIFISDMYQIVNENAKCSASYQLCVCARCKPCV